jgi:wobble nucleotide-excising tRNase
VVSTLDEPNVDDRVTKKFNNLEYVFIDDPVSSLDDSHLIALAVDLASLIKSSRYVDGRGLRFIVTTHSPLFYNVLFNELSNDLKRENPDGTSTKLYKRDQSEKYRLQKKSDGRFELIASNDHPFSYHLLLLSELRSAISANQIRKFHFNFLRNILEKTATFLGYTRWEDLLEKTAGNVPDPFVNRILNLSSHSAHAGDEVAEMEDSDKERLAQLVLFLSETYRFKK